MHRNGENKKGSLWGPKNRITVLKKERRGSGGATVPVNER